MALVISRLELLAKKPLKSAHRTAVASLVVTGFVTTRLPAVRMVIAVPRTAAVALVVTMCVILAPPAPRVIPAVPRTAVHQALAEMAPVTGVHPVMRTQRAAPRIAKWCHQWTHLSPTRCLRRPPQNHVR